MRIKEVAQQQNMLGGAFAEAMEVLESNLLSDHDATVAHSLTRRRVIPLDGAEGELLEYLGSSAGEDPWRARALGSLPMGAAGPHPIACVFGVGVPVCLCTCVLAVPCRGHSPLPRHRRQEGARPPRGTAGSGGGRQGEEVRRASLQGPRARARRRPPQSSESHRSPFGEWAASRCAPGQCARQQPG